MLGSGLLSFSEPFTQLLLGNLIVKARKVGVPLGEFCGVVLELRGL
jgi:hypothetical protein